nr:tyrosine-type recombinase/integrase [Caballeronia sp. INSB1]
MRHTTATYLLRAGVDINTIRAWLGHVSLNTTNIYAQIDLEMKSRALAQLQPSGETPRRRMESVRECLRLIIYHHAESA